MAIASLGYVCFRAPDLKAWSDYGTSLLGLQVADRSRDMISFRMDDLKQRIIIETGRAGEHNIFGWDACDESSLSATCDALDAASVAYVEMPESLCRLRGVNAGISFKDPAGNQIEVFHGPVVAHGDFAPSRAISGFVTGPLGLGHIVLYVKDIEAAHAYYTNVLGFKLSDYVTTPFRAQFYHINPRHHSLALIENTENGVHHLMIELYQLDDVGQGYDIALGDPDRIATTLGRHSNDFMTSFYTVTPSQFLVEYGWGGKLIDVESWQPYEMTDGPSLWGHERAWLTPEGREKAKHMRLDAARRGVKEPVYVTPGNYRENRLDCAWWCKQNV